MSTKSYAAKLRLSDCLRKEVIREAIATLHLSRSSRGLDAGCGIGSHARLLAEAVSPGGQVTGIDASGEFLKIACDDAAAAGLDDRVSFQRADVGDLPFDDRHFDWAWSVDCVGVIGGEPIALLREMSRVLKPEGILAICAWSSQQLLPGHPALEARLNATRQGVAPFTTGMPPERHFLRAQGWMHEVGLTQITARTFTGEIRTPLDENEREALISLFEMRWGDPRSELSRENYEEYRRLCDPNSPEFIPDCRDYYAYFSYTMFSGRRP